MCDIGSVCKQSGRTTGRLGSTGLLAMPSEGRRSRHSGAFLPRQPQPGLDANSDDYGPATTCRRMDLVAAAGALRDRRLRDRRERADTSVRSTGLGVATSVTRSGMCRGLLFD